MRRSKISGNICGKLGSLSVQVRNNSDALLQHLLKFIVFLIRPNSKISLAVLGIMKIVQDCLPILRQIFKAINRCANNGIGHLSFKVLRVKRLSEIHSDNTSAPITRRATVINTLNTSWQFITNNIFGTSAPNNTVSAATVHKRIRTIFWQFAIILFKIIFGIDQ